MVSQLTSATVEIFVDLLAGALSSGPKWKCIVLDRLMKTLATIITLLSHWDLIGVRRDDKREPS